MPAYKNNKKMKEKKKHFELIIDLKTWEQIEKIALDETRSRQFVVNQLIKIGLNQKIQSNTTVTVTL